MRIERPHQKILTRSRKSPAVWHLTRASDGFCPWNGATLDICKDLGTSGWRAAPQKGSGGWQQEGFAHCLPGELSSTCLWVSVLFQLQQQIRCKTMIFPAVEEAVALCIELVDRAGQLLHAFANLLCHAAERPPLALAGHGGVCTITCLVLQQLPWACVAPFYFKKAKIHLSSLAAAHATKTQWAKLTWCEFISHGKNVQSQTSLSEQSILSNK